MRVLVTGGTGLIGTALKTVVERSAATGDSWRFVSNDDCDL